MCVQSKGNLHKNRQLCSCVIVHVSFPRCYVFLCACGNGKLLLQCAIQEAQALNTPDTLAVLTVLQTFSAKHHFDR